MEETMKNTPDADAADGEEARLYELGFHIVPTVGDDKISYEVDAIKGVLESNGAKIISEEQPQLMKLAYPMRAEIDRRKYTYASAYFGWMHFEATPEKAHTIKGRLARNEHILRFLLIKTVTEGADVPHPATSAPGGFSEPGRSEEPALDAPEAVIEAPEAQPINVAQIDAEIEKLVVE
jgi:ribosomal protein S6